MGLLQGSHQPFQEIPQREEFEYMEEYLTLEVSVSVSLRQSDH